MKEGDKSTNFFYKMTNAHRRRNFLAKIKINNTKISEVSEIKDGVVRALQNLLSESRDWRPGINVLSLDVLGD